LNQELAMEVPAEDDLPQQLNDCVQPRLGADELSLAERPHAPSHPRQVLSIGRGV
jgi:hypothetical protein